MNNAINNDDANDDANPSDTLLRLAAAKTAGRLTDPGKDPGETSKSSEQNPDNNPFADQGRPAPQPTWRFGVFSLLMATFVFAVMGAVGNQLLQLVRRGTTPKAAYAMFTLMAPVILVTVVSLARSFTVWFHRR